MMSYGKAETVGYKTAGHDTVQELFQLSNGSAVRLTTGRWSGALESVVNDGRVEPQFEVKLTTYQSTNRYLLADKDDPQFQTALDRSGPMIAAREEAAQTDEESVSPTETVKE